MSIALSEVPFRRIADINQTWRDGRLAISLIQLQATVRLVGPLIYPDQLTTRSAPTANKCCSSRHVRSSPKKQQRAGGRHRIAGIEPYPGEQGCLEHDPGKRHSTMSIADVAGDVILQTALRQAASGQNQSRQTLREAHRRHESEPGLARPRRRRASSRARRTTHVQSGSQCSLCLVRVTGVFPRLKSCKQHCIFSSH